jgi:signal transduction histidine kinase
LNFTLIFAQIGDSSRVVGLAPQRDSSGATVGAFGFVAETDVYARSLINQLWRHPQILPLAITRGLPIDSLLTALVSTPDGNEVYRSSGWSAALRSDTASLARAAGGLRVRVALRPDAVARLGKGLIPSARVPVWVGLLLLTGLLTAIILRNLQREHELARLRADFTASVSHELRTPLAQIMLFGETLTLGRTRSETERVRAAEVIVREARRLMQLVENTLQFSRAERPVVGLSPERVELAPALREVIAGFEPLAETRGVSIVADLDDTSAAIVDRSALRQMVLNLLDNALKYGPRDQTITVTLSAPQSTMAQISVDDEGPGIFGRSREDIWAPFVRGESSDHPATGCGLGLAVVRELATRHSGRAWVETAPDGRGARFVVELPCADADGIAETAPSAVA